MASSMLVLMAEKSFIGSGKDPLLPMDGFDGSPLDEGGAAPAGPAAAFSASALRMAASIVVRWWQCHEICQQRRREDWGHLGLKKTGDEIAKDPMARPTSTSYRKSSNREPLPASW